MRILIVEDEPQLAAQLGRSLEAEQYTVDLAPDGEAALDRLFVDPYDLVLLDIMLPGLDGLEVLARLREEKITIPVLMLTARGDTRDRIRGLDLGADDYLAKPFAMGELLARIRALLRRGTAAGSSLLTAAGLSLNTALREVQRGKTPVELTPREFAILEFLLYNKNRAVSRYTMAEHVWGDGFDPLTMSNSIDVHVKNLRRKLGDTGAGIIRTVRGVGYMIRDAAP